MQSKIMVNNNNNNLLGGIRRFIDELDVVCEDCGTVLGASGGRLAPSIIILL